MQPGDAVRSALNFPSVWIGIDITKEGQSPDATERCLPIRLTGQDC
jgi:hypothetical protein